MSCPHHRQPVGVGQGAFIGQQQAMVVLRQTRVIGEHARIRQFEMHPVEVHVRRDDVDARMLHIRRQQCDLAGLDMQGPLPYPHWQDAPTHEHQLEGVDGAPHDGASPVRTQTARPSKVHRPFEPTCRDAHGYQSRREQISAAQPDDHFVFATVGPGEVRDERGGDGLALDRRVDGVEAARTPEPRPRPHPRRPQQPATARAKPAPQASPCGGSHLPPHPVPAHRCQ